MLGMGTTPSVGTSSGAGCCELLLAVRVLLLGAAGGATAAELDASAKRLLLGCGADRPVCIGAAG